MWERTVVSDTTNSLGDVLGRPPLGQVEEDLALAGGEPEQGPEEGREPESATWRTSSIENPSSGPQGVGQSSRLNSARAPWATQPAMAPAPGTGAHGQHRDPLVLIGGGQAGRQAPRAGRPVGGPTDPRPVEHQHDQVDVDAVHRGHQGLVGGHHRRRRPAPEAHGHRGRGRGRGSPMVASSTAIGSTTSTHRPDVARRPTGPVRSGPGRPGTVRAPRRSARCRSGGRTAGGGHRRRAARSGGLVVDGDRASTVVRPCTVRRSGGSTRAEVRAAERARLEIRDGGARRRRVRPGRRPRLRPAPRWSRGGPGPMARASRSPRTRGARTPSRVPNSTATDDDADRADPVIGRGRHVRSGRSMA